MTDDSKSKIDIEWYAKQANKLIDLAWDEYKQETFDSFNTQHTLLRNYLWLATALFSAECVGFSSVFDGTLSALFGVSLNAHLVFVVLAAMSAACSLLSVGLGLDSMRGQVDTALPFYGKDTAEYLSLAWQEASEEVGKTTVQLDIILQLNKAIKHNRERSKRKGKRLRSMSCLLLASLGTGLCALASAVIIF